MDVNRQETNTSVEHSKKSTTSRNSHHSSGSRRHSPKTSFSRKLKRRLFGKKQRVSGVKKRQIHAERRVMMWLVITAVVLLLVLIPLFTWIAELVNNAPTV